MNAQVKLEILLALTFKGYLKVNADPLTISAPGSFSPTDTPAGKPDVRAVEKGGFSGGAEESVNAFSNQLSAADIVKFKNILNRFQNLPEPEQTAWHTDILHRLGSKESLIDTGIHWSHIISAVKKEPSAIQKIIIGSLQPLYKDRIDFPPAERKQDEKNREFKKFKKAVEKQIILAFAEQFISIQDLSEPHNFDYLSGIQLTRLLRLLGTREVALACAKIESVESVNSFLKRFPAEDIMIIARQLKKFKDVSQSEKRLRCAESLVEAGLRFEPASSSLLDLLGIWLTAAHLYNNKPRLLYAQQKLPVEVALEIKRFLDEHHRHIPDEIRQEISFEVEELARIVSRDLNEDERISH